MRNFNINLYKIFKINNYYLKKMIALFILSIHIWLWKNVFGDVVFKCYLTFQISYLLE